MNLRTSIFRIALLLLSVAPPSFAQLDNATRQLSRDIFKELIEINTTDSVGSVTAASEAMAKRLRDAGFPDSDIQVLGPNDRKKNLVARLRGTGKRKPILLISHLDVVEARREDWNLDPFQFIEKDGYFYGRGTQDIKSGDAILVTTFLRMKKEGYKPDRDLILALTADEEGGKSNGVDWLLKNDRDLVEAEYVLNDDHGWLISEHGKPVIMEVDATEKLYADYQLEATNPGGHSSLPVPDNAVYHLADALGRLERYEFPVDINNVTRAYYERMAQLSSGQRAEDMQAILKDPPDPAAVARLSQDPVDHSKLRTTCVATRLEGGHANNALPQMARANVNCRIAPGHSAEEIRLKLAEIVADPKVSVKFVGAIGGVTEHATNQQAYAPPPLRPDVFEPLEKIVQEMWPGVPVVPSLATGASDGVYTNAAGLPTYGISGTAIDRDDVRAHGRDERMAVKSYYEGVDFYYRYLKALTTG